MGMFSAQKKSPNATICFMSSKIRSIKKGTVDYLDEVAAETGGCGQVFYYPILFYIFLVYEDRGTLLVSF